ncbi:NB-ARC domain-containing protein [Amycolatopsis sp. NPDC088138]|uniref:NB-ARC domain-containing protein n=1 Tax=Amycolatopsis sp. NPDC088138 TaxID=3363938 RepID=UPI0037F1EB3C
MTVNQATAPRTAAMVTAITAGTRDPGELFIGRDTQIGQLPVLLASVPRDSRWPVVSAVAGMGGVGKTALARRIASIAAHKEWFAGGIAWVNLRGYDLEDDHVHPEQVFGPVLRLLGVRGEDIPTSPDDQATVYHHVLNKLGDAGRRVLLVLDNAAAGQQVLRCSRDTGPTESWSPPETR